MKDSQLDINRKPKPNKYIKANNERFSTLNLALTQEK